MAATKTTKPKANFEASLSKAVKRVLASMEVDEKDVAAATLVVRLADQFDQLEAAGEHKAALYAAPHFINALRELGATPMSTKAKEGDGDDEDADSPEATLARLRAV